MQFEQKVFTYDWLAPPSYFECFYVFMQKGRTWRFSVCPFYVRVKLLYTPRCKPAESVTVNFFIGDPIFGAPERPTHNRHVCGPVPGTDYMGGTLYRLPDPVLLLRAMKD